MGAMGILPWANQWNSIIRNVIYQDDELKELMAIPDKTNIMTFIDRYFVKAGYTTKLLTDEKVRIVYSDTQPIETAVPNVKRAMMMFDIYVKLENLHDFGQDRLIARTQLIGAKLADLLTTDEFCNKTGYRFRTAGEWDGGTRTIGYARYTIGFYYMKVY